MIVLLLVLLIWVYYELNFACVIGEGMAVELSYKLHIQRRKFGALAKMKFGYVIPEPDRNYTEIS